MVRASSNLDEYQRKRDASKTNEPFGRAGAEGQTTVGAFVVHQHDATRMHYDLRLEVSGVLASFAVPHGPTLDPAAKHLAIHTEDHPIEYLDFEAVIPDGNYGAGAMILWDTGRVRYLEQTAEEGLRAGKLDFVLEGRKLQGRFALVRMKPRGRDKPAKDSHEWLLLKKRDAHSSSTRNVIEEEPRSILSGLTVKELGKAAELAQEIEEEAASLGAPEGDLDERQLSPMLCKSGPVPEGEGWIHELKLDGVRILAKKRDDRATLAYRTGRPATSTYPEVTRAVRALAASRLVLDGEIVAFDAEGVPSFQRLGRRIHVSRPREVRRLMLEVPVVMMVFDLLQIGARDVSELPLVDRKRLLARILPGSGVLRALDHLEGGGEKLLAFCRERNLEGIVSKRAHSGYQPGPKRGGDWVKTRLLHEEDFVVVGVTYSGKKRRIGSLDIASYEGGELRLRGKVGSGLDEQAVTTIAEMVPGLASDEPMAEGTFFSAPNGRTYLQPSLVVRVRFLELTKAGTVRHPVFVGLRADVAPEDCTVSARAGDGDPPPAARSESDEAADPAAPEPLHVAITNRSKVFWSEEGYVKGDLVDYYDAVADVLLPHLADRPVVLVRYPDGIDGKSFYQWNVPHGMPSWIRWIPFSRHTHESSPEHAHKRMFVIDRRESLLYIANLACIPIHVLASRVSTPDQCDFLTIDFDVGRASLKEGVALARTLREVLDEVGLAGFPKTSGQTGLHVLVPLGGAGVSPRAARAMADLLGRIVTERHPEIATMERTVARRGARVYVDTGQTGPARTIVAPYSVRATAGARVSTPLDWSEVTPDLDPAAFTIETVPARLASRDDPMAMLLEARPDVSRVMAAFERLTQR